MKLKLKPLGRFVTLNISGNEDDSDPDEGDDDNEEIPSSAFQSNNQASFKITSPKKEAQIESDSSPESSPEPDVEEVKKHKRNTKEVSPADVDDYLTYLDKCITTISDLKQLIKNNQLIGKELKQNSKIKNLSIDGKNTVGTTVYFIIFSYLLMVKW